MKTRWGSGEASARGLDAYVLTMARRKGIAARVVGLLNADSRRALRVGRGFAMAATLAIVAVGSGLALVHVLPKAADGYLDRREKVMLVPPIVTNGFEQALPDGIKVSVVGVERGRPSTTARKRNVWEPAGPWWKPDGTLPAVGVPDTAVFEPRAWFVPNIVRPVRNANGVMVQPYSVPYRIAVNVNSPHLGGNPLMVILEGVGIITSSGPPEITPGGVLNRGTNYQFLSPADTEASVMVSVMYGPWHDAQQVPLAIAAGNEAEYSRNRLKVSTATEEYIRLYSLDARTGVKGVPNRSKWYGLLMNSRRLGRKDGYVKRWFAVDREGKRTPLHTDFWTQEVRDDQRPIGGLTGLDLTFWLPAADAANTVGIVLQEQESLAVRFDHIALRPTGVGQR